MYHFCYSILFLLCFRSRLYIDAVKGLLLALVCDVKLQNCHFPIGIQGQAWCLILFNPDLCPFFFTFIRI